MTVSDIARSGGVLGGAFSVSKSTANRGGVTGWASDTRARSSGGLSADDARAFMANVKSFGGGLMRAANNLLSRDASSGFNALAGASSIADAMTVTVSNQADAMRFNRSGGVKKVEIQQTAATQQNTGASLSANAISAAGNGTNSFEIEKGGKTFSFSININATDSNRTAQQKMADTINRQSAGTGISASVSFNEKTRTSSVVLTTRETGAAQSFTIRDTNGGNAVSTLGANNVTQQARDARYTVDGAARQSAKNEVDLGDGLRATLQKPTADAAEVTVTRDTKQITNGLYDVVNNYNQLREAAINAGKDRNAQGLRQRLDTLAAAYAGALSQAGITRNQDGYWQIDQDKLQKGIENGAAERVLGANSMLTQRLSQTGKMADTNPSQFISPESRRNITTPVANTADSTGAIRLSPFQQMRTQQWSFVGMLLDIGI